MNAPYRSLYPAHLDLLQQRWEDALEAEHLDAVVLHSGTPLVSFLDDYEYAFRPNPHFLQWLPLTQHADCALLIAPGQRPRLFYYQPDDYWYLPPRDPEPWWADHFDIEVVRDAGGWRNGVEGRLGSPSAARVAVLGDAPSLAEVFAAEQVNPGALLGRLHVARTRKTAYELACMEAATDLAARAHVAAERAFREGQSEYGIHLRYLEACGHTDSELPYNSIVALNEHGAVLHYQARERTAPDDARSFLLDAGAAVNAYAADITRTYAYADGAFADLVAALDRLQQELCSEVRAGLDFRDLHLRTHRGIAALLREAGVIRAAPDDAVASGLSAVFYPHGLGHFIGLQVHDVAGLIDNEGKPRPRPEGHASLRLTRDLEPDNVLTIEPGLYFIDLLLQRWRENGDATMLDWDRVDALRPYGGIRIEDNVVVTADGCDNLTRRAFAALDG